MHCLLFSILRCVYPVTYLQASGPAVDALWALLEYEVHMSKQGGDWLHIQPLDAVQIKMVRTAHTNAVKCQFTAMQAACRHLLCIL
jgi:hypothetical protein